MKKLIKSSLLVILFAIVLANLIYNRYKEELTEDTIIYYLQQTVSKEEPKDIKNPHITVFEEEKYYTYIGITKSKKTAEKVRDFYKEQGTILYIKEANTKNNEFLNELTQYDILLNNATEKEEMENILETILATFEETS